MLTLLGIYLAIGLFYFVLLYSFDRRLRLIMLNPLSKELDELAVTTKDKDYLDGVRNLIKQNDELDTFALVFGIFFISVLLWPIMGFNSICEMFGDE